MLLLIGFGKLNFIYNIIIIILYNSRVIKQFKKFKICMKIEMYLKHDIYYMKKI